MTRTRFAVHALALVGLLVLALGVSACGGSDDSDAGNAAGVGSSSEKQELLDARAELLDLFFAGDAEGYCAGLTPASVKNAPKTMGYPSCEEMVRKVIPKPVGPEGRPKPEILAVNIDGDRGTVTTHEQGFKRKVVSVFIKQNGRWLAEVGSRGTSQSPRADP